MSISETEEITLTVAELSMPKTVTSQSVSSSLNEVAATAEVKKPARVTPT